MRSLFSLPLRRLFRRGPYGTALLACFCLASAALLTWGLDRVLQRRQEPPPSSLQVTEAHYQGGWEGPAGPVGEPAPDFALPDLEGERVVRLSEVLDDKPVVLVFGSLT